MVRFILLTSSQTLTEHTLNCLLPVGHHLQSLASVLPDGPPIPAASPSLLLL